jgi:hypothetical protein
VVVAANPGTLATIEPELDLVKAALLYGDKVTLLSPVTTMLLRVDGIQHFPLAARLELVRRVAPYIADPAGLPALEESLEEFGELLNAVERGPAGSRYMLGQVTRQLGAELREIDEVVKHICREAHIDQLARARNDGVLQIESADPGDEIDLLASCLKSAKLAEMGRSEEDPHAGRIVETFADRLSHHLSSGSEYLIFDEPIASLTEAGIREGRFTPAPGPSGKCAQAMTASALMARLPTFPLATVDEVLDIRAELNPALTQFRSAMVTTAKNFTSAAWETGFEDEVHTAWVETVQPALESIDNTVRDDKSLSALASNAFSAAKTAFPGLVIVATGLSGHLGQFSHAAQLGGGALTATAPIAKMIRESRVAERKVRMQPFYFLYATEEALLKQL